MKNDNEKKEIQPRMDTDGHGLKTELVEESICPTDKPPIPAGIRDTMMKLDAFLAKILRGQIPWGSLNRSDTKSPAQPSRNQSPEKNSTANLR